MTLLASLLQLVVEVDLPSLSFRILSILIAKTEQPRKNIDQAIEWYTLAAEQGHDKAQAALGTLLLDCRQRQEALKWLHLAADKEEHVNADALLQLVYVYEEEDVNAVAEQRKKHPKAVVYIGTYSFLNQLQAYIIASTEWPTESSKAAKAAYSKVDTSLIAPKPDVLITKEDIECIAGEVKKPHTRKIAVETDLLKLGNVMLDESVEVKTGECAAVAGIHVHGKTWLIELGGFNLMRNGCDLQSALNSFEHFVQVKCIKIL
ncbi:hypothetical protein K492DRAFT_187889 [Lichtheimia hyalospora FSU 10163]|nr:hypothetical protein K492DRAFT_187889 [Lichtheimia hyalospora FSU 10163]